MVVQRDRRRQLGALLLLIACFLAACGEDSSGFGVGSAGDGPADYSFLIPAGAGDRFDAGDPIEILPPDLPVTVGEIIEIVNEDDRGHLVGPFYVAAGETFRHSFASPGEFVGICTVHESGQITLTVTEAP